MTADRATRTRATPSWLVAGVAGLFGLLHAYAVWSAVTSLVALAQETAAVGLSLTVTAWAVLLLAVVVPIATFALALAIGRRGGILRLVLLFLAGLALTAAFWLDMQAYTMTATIIG